MKAIADTMGVARSHLVERMKPKTQSARSRYNKADDAWLLPPGYIDYSGSKKAGGLTRDMPMHDGETTLLERRQVSIEGNCSHKPSETTFSKKSVVWDRIDALTIG